MKTFLTETWEFVKIFGGMFLVLLATGAVVYILGFAFEGEPNYDSEPQSIYPF